MGCREERKFTFVPEVIEFVGWPALAGHDHKHKPRSQAWVLLLLSRSTVAKNLVPCSTRCYTNLMHRTITQRELRNSSAEVMDAVEAGETLVITRNGNPVGELRPIRRRQMVPVSEVIENFADCPPANYRQWRADLDALFGEERV